jgi:hypothetical protein
MDACGAIERLGRLLADEGYALSVRADGSTLATKRGHSAGIFLHDLDDGFPPNAGEFEAIHRRANKGEKNSVCLVDLVSGKSYSQGLEIDRFSRYGGEWSPNVNPSNRVARMLAAMLAEALPQ